MSEISRIQGPGGAEPGGRKDRSGNVDDDKFRKIMKVEEVHEIDPREKRKRKLAQETEDETEGLKKAGGVTSDKKKVKRIENDDGAPLARKKPTSKAKPSTPPPASSKSHTPMAAFNPNEIQPYAWEEEANAPSSAVSGAGSKTKSTQEPRISSEETPKLAKSPGEGTASKALTSNQEPTPITPPLSHEPNLHFETEADFREEATPKEVDSKSALNAEPGISEEWPQTTTYRPEPEPHTAETIPNRPLTPSESLQPSQTTSDRDTDHAEPITPVKKKEAAAKKTKSPDLPGLPGKDTKKNTASFAEHMQEKPEATAAPNKKISAEERTKLSGAPGTPGAGMVIPATGTPQEQQVKEALPTPLPGISRQDAGFTSLKKTGTTTISSEKNEQTEKVVEEGQIPLTTGAQETGTSLGGGGQGQDEGKPRRREGEGIEGLQPTAMGVPTPITPVTTPSQAPAPAPYTQMEPQILALFERMVGVMTIIQTTGISETVMTLNARQFASSVLYGSQIIIREFSTAPKAFNVEFIGSPEALAQVQRNIPALLGAVQQGNYQFTINRFDTKLSSTEKPIFSRRESVQENSDQDMHENDKDRETP